MFRLPIRRWSERSRTLMLMLAVLLPAAALIVVSARHLTTIRREKAVEAVIQRDYQQVLAIAEKRIVNRAYEITEDAKSGFPDVDHPEELDGFLATNPDIAHAFLWNEKGNFAFVSQPGKMTNLDFPEEGKKLSSQMKTWFDT